MSKTITTLEAGSGGSVIVLAPSKERARVYCSEHGILQISAASPRTLLNGKWRGRKCSRLILVDPEELYLENTHLYIVSTMAFGTEHWDDIFDLLNREVRGA